MKCANCGESFVDLERREIATTGIDKRDRSAVSGISIFFAACGLFFALMMIIIGLDEPAALKELGLIPLALFVVIPCLPAIIQIAGHRKRLTELQKLSDESFNRLKDAGYAQRLKNTGYPVPAEFLKRASETYYERGDYDTSRSKTDKSDHAAERASSSHTSGTTHIVHSEEGWTKCPVCDCTLSADLDKCPVCESPIHKDGLKKESGDFFVTPTDI